MERGKGEKRVWVFRTPGEKWNKDMILGKNKGKDICQMFWAGFSATVVRGRDGALSGTVLRSELTMMERDTSSRRAGYSSWSYKLALEEGLLPIWQIGLRFQQDNAPIHTSKDTKAWFNQYAIELLDWPPNSPDLNPIEHLWWALKQKVFELYPELRQMGKTEEAKEAFRRACQEAWTLLPDQLFLKLAYSMERRIKACIKARGWQTKY